MSDPLLFEIMEKLGAIGADVQNLKQDQAEERRTGADFRREVRIEMRAVQDNVTDIKQTIKPVAEKVEQHDATLEVHGKKIDGFTLFQNKIGAAIAVGTSAVSMVGYGIYWLISTYWAELLAFLRGLFPKGG